MIHLVCPNCSVRLKGRDDKLRGSCPRCGHALQTSVAPAEQVNDAFDFGKPSPVAPAPKIAQPGPPPAPPAPAPHDSAGPPVAPGKDTGRPWFTRRRLVVCGASVLLALLVLGLFKGPFAVVGPRKPDLDVTAQELFTAYNESQPLADLTYRGKLLRITGEVAAVQERPDGRSLVLAVVRPHRGGFVSLDDYYARVAAASASGVQGVRCHFRDPALTPKSGRVVLIGRCDGMPLDVVLRDCEVVP